jgi:hypothetical protein
MSPFAPLLLPPFAPFALLLLPLVDELAAGDVIDFLHQYLPRT